MIRNSEALRQQQINEAEVEASAILAVARATSGGLRMVAHILDGPGGLDAARLRVAEDYVLQFGELAKASNTLIVPASASELSSMLATAFSVFDMTGSKKGPSGAPSKPGREPPWQPA